MYFQHKTRLLNFKFLYYLSQKRKNKYLYSLKSNIPNWLYSSKSQGLKSTPPDFEKPSLLLYKGLWFFSGYNNQQQGGRRRRRQDDKLGARSGSGEHGCHCLLHLCINPSASTADSDREHDWHSVGQEVSTAYNGRATVRGKAPRFQVRRAAAQGRNGGGDLLGLPGRVRRRRFCEPVA